MNAHVVLGALLFACAAIAGLVLAAAICARVKAYDDGPQTGAPPVVGLVAGAALIGGIAGAHVDTTHLGITALVAGAFVAAWYCDVARGVVPDAFTIGPLAIFAALALVWHDPRAIVHAGIVFVPFALAATLSKGRGMGWGDAKLAAVAGALLGASGALLACAMAAFGAAIGAKFRPAGTPRPLAFAPYIIGACAMFLAWNVQ